ncbi:MAG TPA: winged helix-turn-helix domain-containing protein [Jiangellaceae bacterium]|nr:winged helix-turn-helix domain-containing protein [Jiangellaceae bacterium]
MVARRRQVDAPPLTVGGVTLDVAGRRAIAGGRELALTKTQFGLLEHLMRHPGRVCSRAELMSEVWGYREPIGTRTIDVHVAALRAKLGWALPISTVRGQGYRVDPVG